jgi:hypothetical protein
MAFLKHYTNNILTLQHKATSLLLRREYSPAAYYFGEAADTIITLSLLEDRLTFAKNGNFQTKLGSSL